MKTKKTRAALTISMPQEMATRNMTGWPKDWQKTGACFSEKKCFSLSKNSSLKEEFRELQTYGAGLTQQKGCVYGI